MNLIKTHFFWVIGTICITEKNTIFHILYASKRKGEQKVLISISKISVPKNIGNSTLQDYGNRTHILVQTMG